MSAFTNPISPPLPPPNSLLPPSPPDNRAGTLQSTQDCPRALRSAAFERSQLHYAGDESGSRGDRKGPVRSGACGELSHDGIPQCSGEALGRPVRAVHNWHNIESEAMRRYGSTVSSLPRKIYASFTARRLVRLEEWILRTGFGHVVCSTREKDELLARAPKARVTIIENGVDMERFAPASDGGPRRRLVYIGTMDYYPNVEAVTWFTRRIWPRVRERFPEWRLTLVGGNPWQAVRDLGKEPGVEVTGTVPDVRPYYRDAVASIVPLHTGGGTRLKILEAMASGVPVISTTIGAEGLAVSPGRNIDIVDDEAGWLPALEILNSQERLREERISGGLQLVRTSYDWRMLGQRLYEDYGLWLASTPA